MFSRSARQLGSGNMLKSPLRSAFRRAASTTPTTPVPPPPPPIPATTPVVKKKRIGFFRLTWRLTWLSLLGSAAYLTYEVYKEVNPSPQIPQSPLKPNGNRRKTVVILGSGWGAISTLKHLDTSLYNVVVVSPRNYFLFTPLLPSVPTGTIDLKSIIDPVRTIAKSTPGEVTYLEAEATDIDIAKKQLTIQHSSYSATSGVHHVTIGGDEAKPIVATIEYDYLVFAIGAQTATFGIPGIEKYAYYLKETDDAARIRRSLFETIEASQLLPKDSEERKRLLSVVVCGGGPTGVELAAEIKDYIDEDLSRFVPGIENEMSVTLVEALPNVLNAFNHKLIEYTESIFEKQQLDLRVNTMVKKVDDKNVYATVKKSGGDTENVTIPYGTLVWATGNGPRPLTKAVAAQIEEQKTARRGLLIGEHLLVDGTDSVFALGDCTFTKNPPTAQVAHQEGIYLASHLAKLSKIDDLKHEIGQNTDPEQLVRLQRRLDRTQASILPFKYTHQGALAYIGSERAVADLVWGDWSNVSTGGSLTFLFWRSAYVSMMLGVRTKILVVSDWIKVKVFGRDCSKE
ncbi:hypothetical protein LJB42_002107 [Komagataella kurtzmanii]|nr:hypothetical protein LJB42_002107 [Komagataella kurtzmanii]